MKYEVYYKRNGRKISAVYSSLDQAKGTLRLLKSQGLKTAAMKRF